MLADITAMCQYSACKKKTYLYQSKPAARDHAMTCVGIDTSIVSGAKTLVRIIASTKIEN